MNGDRTESDWQGLVSEVRPRRRPGGMGRAERSPAPSPRPPGGRAGRGLAGDAHPAASGGCFHAPLQVRRSSRPLRPARAPLYSRPAGASLWGGAFPPGRGLPSGQGWALDWREERGDPGVGAKPHLPSRLPLFWSQAIGRPVLKRKGGARGKSGFWGHGRARWNHLQRSFVGEGSSIGSSVAFVHSVIQLSQHVYRGPSACKVARRLSKE